MTGRYTAERLAPGSDDVLLDGSPAATLAPDTDRRTTRTAGVVELSTDQKGSTRPAPFTEVLHKFDGLGTACNWPGAERPA